MERSLKSTKEMFETLKGETTQKVSKMEGEMNILKEGLHLAESSFSSKYKNIRETMEHKFEDFEAYINKCKEKEKEKIKRISKIEQENKNLIKDFEFLKRKLENINEKDFGGMEHKPQANTVNKTVENYIINKLESSNVDMLEKFQEVKKSIIQEALEMTQIHQAKFLDKFSENGNQNDEEVVEMLAEKIKTFEKKIETVRISIQK